MITTLALILLGGMGDEVQLSSDVHRIYDPVFGVACYIVTEVQGSNIFCVQVTPPAPVALKK